MTRHPPLTWAEFFGIVIVAPTVIALIVAIVRYWPQIAEWAKQPYSPWVLAAGCVVALVVFVALVVWDAIKRPVIESPHESCANWREEGPR